MFSLASPGSGFHIQKVCVFLHTEEFSHRSVGRPDGSGGRQPVVPTEDVTSDPCQANYPNFA